MRLIAAAVLIFLMCFGAWILCFVSMKQSTIRIATTVKRCSLAALREGNGTGATRF
jgi:hypothetical protein